MGTAALLAVLGLAALLPADAEPCAAQRPDSATAAELPGTWLYVAGAAQFPQHRVEMLLIDHALLRLEPGASGQELLVSHFVAVGDQCFTNNLTYLEVTAGNATLVKHAKTQQTEGMLMNMSSENLLLIQYQMQRERTYLGQYLYARNLSISTADREEFQQHAECLGLRAEQIVYAPWKTEVCRVKAAEGSNSPHAEPVAAGTASPAPGTPWPGSAGN
ncbi:alpha-1-acid glycoprotein-like isoform X1 [Pyrgilauda ruficollis]|uniref:alpha-1-acid glycoprotein-like isoform X1 n=1 Tax=Pyrgilauda ruficollis TaxID=221976 RepID=UPI001B86DB18|nr:alpha-1-acid glycoprotein-like isoform X1 [Pyrgilauda ruficollis]